MLRAALALAAAVLAAVPAGAAELVMFESARCPWCVKWHREIGPIYDKTDEGRLLPLRRLEHPGPKPDGLILAQPVRYTPTFVVAACGREVGRVVGYGSEDQFWGELAAVAAKVPHCQPRQTP